MGPWKKNVISWNSLYEKTLYQELLIQRNIVIKKGTSEKTRYIEKNVITNNVISRVYCTRKKKLSSRHMGGSNLHTLE